jgi:methyltransferase-like protein
MKKLLSLIAVLGSITSSLHARTWTSADGAKTFEGKYLSSTATTVKVLKNGKSLTVNLDMFSEADQKWVTEEAARLEAEKNKPEEAEIEETPVSKLLEGNVKRFDEKKYKKATLTKNPEYYIIYFTASW